MRETKVNVPCDKLLLFQITLGWCAKQGIDPRAACLIFSY